jgi:hypothetical protein
VSLSKIYGRCGLTNDVRNYLFVLVSHTYLRFRYLLTGFLSDAPARLKKELDTVLALQADMATSDQALQTTCTMLEREAASDNTMVALDGLERGHQRLMEKVEALYASLNIQDRFPELQGVNLDFVRTLLMARDDTHETGFVHGHGHI